MFYLLPSTNIAAINYLKNSIKTVKGSVVFPHIRQVTTAETTYSLFLASLIMPRELTGPFPRSKYKILSFLSPLG